MKATASRKKKPHHVASCGRTKVPVYRRRTPQGNFAFMVANYASGKRRFDSYSTENDAVAAATRLARQLSKRDVITASMTQEQAIEYASSIQTLEPFKIPLVPAVTALAEAIKILGDLSLVTAAAKFYAARHKPTIHKRVSEVVAELLSVKSARGMSQRYLQDLRSRLSRFSEAFCRDACNVTTAEVQQWLDSLKLSSQSYSNYRRVVFSLFQFAVARGYASDNPVASSEKVKVRTGEIGIYTAEEVSRLLAAASPEFLPCLAIGAFAGLRSAEIERLDWSEIHLAERFIVVGANKAKTAGRRIVPIHDNLAQWLAPYAEGSGNVWKGGANEFYKKQKSTASATRIESDANQGVKALDPVKWKANALRHSYASYRFAQIGDAGRVAGELGNSAAVVHRHYREIVKPADAERWFALRPVNPPNVFALPTATYA